MTIFKNISLSYACPSNKSTYKKQKTDVCLFLTEKRETTLLKNILQTINIHENW